MIGVLPLILIAVVEGFVEGKFIFVDFATKVQYELDVYQVNFIGLFCIIPFIIVAIARLLRGKGLLERHFKVIIIATLVLSIVYIGLIVWIIALTVRNYSPLLVFKKIDYVSVACVLLCLSFCTLSNFLPELKPNPVFGVKNRYTDVHSDIWKKVNATAASALTYIFLIDCVMCAYLKQLYSIFALLLAIFVYYVWVMLYSRYAYNRYIKRHPELKK